MAKLDTGSRFPDPDRAYRTLIEAHRGLTDEESALLNTRLVLILANHIGDEAVLEEALALAKRAMQEPAAESSPAAPDLEGIGSQAFVPDGELRRASASDTVAPAGGRSHQGSASSKTIGHNRAEG